jgi:4-hydroxy-tetrahydrodipicolinate reductase
MARWGEEIFRRNEVLKALTSNEILTKIAITGAAGQMGRTVIDVCRVSEGVVLTAAIERAGSPMIGVDAGEVAGIGRLGVTITERLADVTEAFDVLIDFSYPEATIDHVAICCNSKRRLVIGTTGISEAGREAIQEAAQDCAIVLSPNMSIGVSLCFKLVELAACVLGDEVDIEVIEAHHRHKIDAPSGTALRMGEVVAKTLGRDLKQCAVYGRQGKTGERDIKTIGFETIRAGDIVGEHTVMFAGIGERVEITHRASSRATFAKGALRAARWLMQHQQGLFDMQDVLGLS